jgi:hypothetical protein
MQNKLFVVFRKISFLITIFVQSCEYAQSSATHFIFLKIDRTHQPDEVKP